MTVFFISLSLSSSWCMFHSIFCFTVVFYQRVYLSQYFLLRCFVCQRVYMTQHFLLSCFVYQRMYMAQHFLFRCRCLAAAVYFTVCYVSLSLSSSGCICHNFFLFRCSCLAAGVYVTVSSDIILTSGCGDSEKREESRIQNTVILGSDLCPVQCLEFCCLI
jgi:hypothetical protein